MNPTDSGLTPTEELERKADIARARLLKVVDALDARRHDIKQIVPSGAPSKIPLIIELSIPIGAATVGAGALAVSAVGSSRRRWLAPEPMWVGVLKKAGMSLLAYALVEAGKVAIKKVTTRKPPINGMR